MPPRPRMRALSIRQPYAELILRGIKTIEYRSRRTRIIGERFYIYAPRTPGPSEAWAELDCETDNPRDTGNAGDPGVPTGVIVGSAVIDHCVENNDHPRKYPWHLSDVKRLKRPRKPKRMPQPVWFTPF